MQGGGIAWSAMGKRQAKEKLARRRVASERRAAHRAPVRPGRLSPDRVVPASIPRPPYAPDAPPLVPAVPPDEFADRMRAAGRAGREILLELQDAVRIGMTTDELDRICHEACIARGGYPSPLHYKGFPKSLCTSVNEVICHGIPDDRQLLDGDILNCDVTIYLHGVHGDCNATFLVGDVDDDGRRLVQVTKEAMFQAKKVQIVADDEISIKTGDAEIVMKKNGDITIKGGKITIKGSSDVVVKGSKIANN